MIFNFPLGKPDKKGNVEASTALNTETVKDESGNFLPRVFVDSNDGKVDDYGALLPADDEEAGPRASLGRPAPRRPKSRCYEPLNMLGGPLRQVGRRSSVM